ncbi:MAG: long-chain acyl-CoA synthetase [Thermoleophilaceae bacterium]|jgi:long-chain acyl-CoA synthetase|nr:long-chain acyl-CoA synthetase [Thermoleophilaceae bacterium]
MLDASASASADRVALVYGEERVTYADLADQVERLAGALAARGIGPGDPVAILLPNVPAFATAFLGVLRSGAVVVPLNPQFKEAELEFHFRECGVRAVITDADGIDSCRSVAARLSDPPELYDSLPEGEPAGPPPTPGPDDHAVFQYSSGSTGRPKRVPRTHGQLRAEADSYVAATGMSAEDTLFCTIPLFHTYGMGCCLLAAVRSGATLVLFEDPNPFVLQRGRALALLEREGVTLFPAVPFTFRLLAEAVEEADLSGLRLCFSAAAALPRSTFDAFHGRFGVPVRQLYGCTEAGAVTVNTDDDPYATAASAGRPIDGVELRVVDAAGEPLEHGRIGEILIRSAAMTAGYGDAEELNREAFRDGWFRSGDRGRVDEEGRLFITGRKKLLIDVRGDKVDPIEVEDVLAVHPKVEEVVVVGVDSGVPGEELVKAVVVPAGDCQERELIRYCRERLADYKVPSRVEFREEMPVGTGGKVLRKYLID